LTGPLDEQHVDYVTFTVAGEPSTGLVREGAALAEAHTCDLVIGIGGGSTIDAAKAVAALAANGGDPLDYIEVVGRGQQLTRPSLPVIAIPTTAGAGAEVTRNAVLTATEHQVKASLRSPTMLPRLALVDPELTHSLPPDVTASTGLDALTQLVEPFTSGRANPLTDGFCREGMNRVARSLARAVRHGRDEAAREDMALASLLGGLALANAGLGVAHGFAGPVGGMFPAPHGAVCAAFLPHVMAANLAALRQRQRDNPVLKRYDEIARILTGKPSATADDGVTWVQELAAELRIPRLGAYGVTEADIPALVEKTAVASSTKANPIALTRDELTEILFRAL
jgi:alcohol dehydrogenase class IV